MAEHETPDRALLNSVGMFFEPGIISGHDVGSSARNASQSRAKAAACQLCMCSLSLCRRAARWPGEGSARPEACH